jgi:hypothetical protein
VSALPAAAPAIDFSEFKARINAVRVAPELLGEIMAALAVLPAVERDDFEARATRIIGFLKEKRIGKDYGLLAMAATIRLMALDSVLDDRLVQTWLLPGPQPGVAYVHSDLMRAIAEEPVIEGPQGEPVFAIPSFSRRLAQIARAQGSA